MTKIPLKTYFSWIEEKQYEMFRCQDSTKRLPIYIELIQYKLIHSYILQELPYYYICSLYDWVHLSIIYVEYCLSIVDSRASLRMLHLKQEIIEIINKIIEITSNDYDNLRKLYTLLIKSNDILVNLHNSLTTMPILINNTHLANLINIINQE